MISENFEAWLQTLETTDLPQSTQSLAAEMPDGSTGYCCLGIACKIAPEGDQYLQPDKNLLMPPSVADWLGLAPFWNPSPSHPDREWDSYREHAGTVLDIVLDVPEDLEVNDVGISTWSAANMNDWGLTFAQIAQMIRYFGVKSIKS